MDSIRHESFNDALTKLLNRHSVEIQSNTPDHILAGYLIGCLHMFNQSVQARDRWFGVQHRQEYWTRPDGIQQQHPHHADDGATDSGDPIAH